MKKKYDSDIKNNVNKLLDRIIIVLIVLIVISGVFLLIRKEEYNKTVIEVNDSKLDIKKEEISVKDEIPFRMCGESAFGSAEVGIVIFPMTQEDTPKYLKFLKVFK